MFESNNKICVKIRGHGRRDLQKLTKISCDNNIGGEGLKRGNPKRQKDIVAAQKRYSGTGPKS